MMKSKYYTHYEIRDLKESMVFRSEDSLEEAEDVLAEILGDYQERGKEVPKDRYAIYEIETKYVYDDDYNIYSFTEQGRRVLF